MKVFITAVLLLSMTTLFAAESRVSPFKFSFYMDPDQYTVDGKIVQNCRYEKFVISDSAQYYDDYKEHQLNITSKIENGREEFTIINEKELFHEVTGWFKPTKECNARISLNIKSALYSAWLRTRPITFTFKDKTRYLEYAFLSAQSIENKVKQSYLKFHYKSVSGSQVNINLLIDGIVDFWPSQSAAINPKTKMPYPLKK